MSTVSRDNRALGSAGLAIGSTPAQLSTARAVAVNINGRTINCPAIATRALTAGHTALAVNQLCALFVFSDIDGALFTVQSAILPASTGVGYVAGAFEFPHVDNRAPIGAILVRSTSAIFTPGTTSLAGAGVATYFDAALDYGRPIPY